MNKPNRKLSIIIVSWNTLEVTRNCLDSVRDHTEYFDVEVLVVDNASDDGSAEMVAEEFPEYRLIRNTENLGFAAANNQAMEVARGEYFLLLNSDTIVYGDVIQASVDYLQENRFVGAMGCRVHNADGSLQPSCSQFPSILNLTLMTLGLDRLPGPSWLHRYHRPVWQDLKDHAVEVVSGCYLMVRRGAVEDVGLLDEDFFFFGEETDWCRRLRKNGWKLHFAPVGEIVHLGGQSSKRLQGHRDVMLTAGLVRLHRKHFGALAGAAVWFLLLLFNASRWSFWRFRSWKHGRTSFQERARHFGQVLSGYGKVWRLSGSGEA